MSYHSVSDVPVPYGRVVRTLPQDLHHDRDYHGEKDHGVAILASNCGGRSGRYHYLDSLLKHLQEKHGYHKHILYCVLYRLMYGVVVVEDTTCL